jgi:hypothetical protein
MLKTLQRRLPQLRRRVAPTTFDSYVVAAPSSQSAIDAVSGWTDFIPAADPEEARASDRSIDWAIECFGSLEGRDVLELGPRDGADTVALDRAGARIDAIEPNRMAFMRCLVTKELLGLTRARFWLGDMVQWLENAEKTYDLVVASDSLVQIENPSRLVELIARRASAAYIRIPLADALLSDRAPKDAVGALIEALKVAGFAEVRTREEADHPDCPALSLFASRTPPSM